MLKIDETNSRSLLRFARRRSLSTRNFRIADQIRFRNLRNIPAHVRPGTTSRLGPLLMPAPVSPCLSTAAQAEAAVVMWPLFLLFQRRFPFRHVRVLSTAAAPIRCQFHQHFKTSFFIQKSFLKFFSSYYLCLKFFREISTRPVHKILVKLTSDGHQTRAHWLRRQLGPADANLSRFLR